MAACCLLPASCELALAVTEAVQVWRKVDVLGCGGRRRRAALYTRAGSWEGSLSAGVRGCRAHCILVGYSATHIQCLLQRMHPRNGYERSVG